MDELMSMMNQLADGETAQVAQSVQDMMRGEYSSRCYCCGPGTCHLFLWIKADPCYWRP